MKIIHALSWYFPQHLGGTEVYVNGLSQRLRAAGHEVLIAAPLAGGAEEERYEHEGISVYRFPIPLHPTRAECQGRALVPGAERFHAWLQTQRPDWVHFHNLSVALSVAEIKAARAAGARVMATNHLAGLGYICQRGTLMRWGEALCDGICRTVKCSECVMQKNGLGKNAARLLARVAAVMPPVEIPGRLGTALTIPRVIRGNLELQHEIFRLLDWFVVLNQWAASALIANGAPPNKVLINYLGISHSLPAANRAKGVRRAGEPVKIGYFGRFVELKGIIELGKAFKRLPRSIPVELEFRGPTTFPTEQKLVAQLKEIIGPDPRVSFCPAVPPEEAAQILAGYDVLCIPSVWFENGPTVMLEAHAAGTPIIGTRIGAMAELVVDGINGRLVPPGDIPALTAALQEVAMHPAETLDVWRAALPATRTMDEIATDYLKLYAAA